MKTFVCMLLMMRRRQCAVDDEETAMYEGVRSARWRLGAALWLGVLQRMMMKMLEMMKTKMRFEYNISMMGKYAVDDEMTLCI